MAMGLPKNRTDGLRNFVKMALNQLEAGNTGEAKLLLIDLINDIGGAYVCVENKPVKISPVPEYNALTDGDYSTWLVQNNID